MEKCIQMKTLFGFLVVALLAGCANTSLNSSDRTNNTGFNNAPLVATNSSKLSPLKQQFLQGQKVATLDLPNDMWERIRRGFSMPDLTNELVEDRTQWYASKPDYLQRMGIRSSKYLFYIVEEVELRNMPSELALLPFIESSFNPTATSGARASGIWQFMPATGKHFDLKQNVFRDDRRDVQASTRAALDYLQRLYNKFGDWHLALAAYNWGEGNISKAIARNQRAGLGTGYEDISMPMETRMYVPKLQAMKNLVRDPLSWHVELPNIPNHPYFQSVPLPRDMDVVVAAKLAEVPLEDFKSLNPSANRPVLLAAGTPTILLPWDNADIFQRNYEASPTGKLATWTAWIAPSTMKVADAAKRAGMSEAEFRNVNGIPPKMLIKAGSALLVPRSARMTEDVTASVADNGHLDLSPEVIAKKKKGKGKKGEKSAHNNNAKSPHNHASNAKSGDKGHKK
jgi:membrane-bound lytic murein transglycosylase D